jgi:phosphohistidine phosphatase
VKRLLLLRHAKALAASTGGEDADRFLSARGREDAARLGRYMKSEGYSCDLALCSPAQRTRDTLEAVLTEFRARPKVKFVAELYLADARTMISIMRRMGGAASALTVVGHNPGIEECARRLCAEPSPGAFSGKVESTFPSENATKQRDGAFQCFREKMKCSSFSTCAMAAIDFDVAHWRDISAGMGELKLFVRPKDLVED